MPIALAVLSSLCFGLALITGRVGLRTIDARSGAAISIPTAAVLLLGAAVVVHVDGFDLRATLIFAGVGLFFPALVTIITFRSNDLLGPTITSIASSTAPLFALVAAALLLGEKIPGGATLSAMAVAAGMALLSWTSGAAHRRFIGRMLLLPLVGAVLRGLAQVVAKMGLAIWPNPLAAALIGYLASSITVLGVHRLRRRGPRAPSYSGIAWFATTGALNGGAVLLMYAALRQAPVWVVAPIVASYPLLTAILGGLFLKDERVSLRKIAGALITVAAIVYLVGGQDRT
jgi:drug/metabolite transporter (DMT)-like permease